MSKSEQLRKEASYEDNDSRAFSLYHKANREERYEKFLAVISGFMTLQRVHEIHEDVVSGKLTFVLTKSEGQKRPRTLDFYPKSNRLLDRQKNEWQSNGLPILLKIIGYTKPHY